MKTQFYFFLYLLLALSAAAQPGALDAGFGNNGYAAFSSAAFIDVGRAIVQQPDGGLVVAGYYRNYPEAPRYLAVRFTPSGQPDLSFGTGGMADIDVIGEASGLALQADGRIVIAGSHSSFTSPGNFTAMRLLPDGTPDASFGVNGVAAVSLNAGQAVCGAMALQADGKIVLAGHIENGGDTDVFLLRLNTDGALDASFGNGGRVQIPLMPRNEIDAMQIQPDGRILLGGSAGVPDNSDWLLLRLLPDGAPDPSFGQSGVVISSISGSFAPEYLNGLALQPDGRIVAVGAFFDEFFNLRAALARYLPDGTLDINFGQGGKVLPAIPGLGNRLDGVAMQPDGKILAAGFVNPDLEDANLLLLRFQPDGSFDTGFGNGGIVESGMSAEAEYGYALILQSDNKIIVAGSFFDTNGEEEVLLARFESGLQPVPILEAEKKQPWVIFPNPCRDMLTVRSDGSGQQLPVQLRLFDMAGQAVLSERLEGRSVLSLRHLPDGVYGLHIIDEQGKVWRERVVKAGGS